MTFEEKLAIGFWRKVQRGAPEKCWPWTGYKKPSGHGMTSHKSLPMHASRKAWILTHGHIPSDLCVNHRCDNAACCNPDHLYLGTRADNMIDFWAQPDAHERHQRNQRHALDAEQLEKLWEMRKGGALLQQCADKFGVHISTVARYITTARKAKLAKIYADRLSGRVASASTAK